MQISLFGEATSDDDDDDDDAAFFRSVGRETDAAAVVLYIDHISDNKTKTESNRKNLMLRDLVFITKTCLLLMRGYTLVVGVIKFRLLSRCVCVVGGTQRFSRSDGRERATANATSPTVSGICDAEKETKSRRLKAMAAWSRSTPIYKLQMCGRPGRGAVRSSLNLASSRVS